MWDWAFDRAVGRLIRTGALEVTFADGKVRRYGEPGVPSVRVTIKDPGLTRRIVLDPDLAVGEAFVDQTIEIENDDLRGFLQLAVQNRRRDDDPWLLKASMALTAPIQWYWAENNPFRSRENVAHHYDLSGALYDLFLDKDRQYSCAYFTDEGMSLDAAQEAKKGHIIGKLCVQPGERVLDIGCGWGGMALTLARDYGAQVVGITLSEEQHALATRRAAEAGLSDRIEFRLQDYRDVEGQFDRIVSVGMFEHVGAAHYAAYFETVSRLLAPHGVALIHTIGTLSPPRATGHWIRKYIFPGGYLPSMSEVLRPIERSGLYTLDVEVWRDHYARTLTHWHDRFMARLDEARALYDERFVRMWRYYLLAAETSFSHEHLAVFQFQLGHSKRAVPITRDYLYTAGQP